MGFFSVDGHKHVIVSLSFLLYCKQAVLWFDFFSNYEFPRRRRLFLSSHFDTTYLKRRYGRYQKHYPKFSWLEELKRARLTRQKI